LRRQNPEAQMTIGEMVLQNLPAGRQVARLRAPAEQWSSGGTGRKMLSRIRAGTC